MDHDRMRDERDRDETRAGGMAGGTGQLARLDDLDGYKVAEGDPDIRGWDVKTADGMKVGKVHDLIVDTNSFMVRYVGVKLDKKSLGLSDEREVLLPIGTARLDDNDDAVLVNAGSAQELRNLPPYQDGQEITREYETGLRGRFATGAATGATASAGSDKDFYEHENFNDHKFWGKRREGREGERYLVLSEEELAVGRRKVQAGEVDVRKRVETERVKQQVPVSHEEVTIERRPASASTSGRPQLGEDEIRVPVMEEEVVVEKRAVPKEEIIIRKEMKQDEKTVEADLRRERVDVNKTGNVERHEGRDREERSEKR